MRQSLDREIDTLFIPPCGNSGIQRLTKSVNRRIEKQQNGQTVKVNQISQISYSFKGRCSPALRDNLLTEGMELPVKQSWEKKLRKKPELEMKCMWKRDVCVAVQWGPITK